MITRSQDDVQTVGRDIDHEHDPADDERPLRLDVPYLRDDAAGYAAYQPAAQALSTASWRPLKPQLGLRDALANVFVVGQVVNAAREAQSGAFPIRSADSAIAVTVAVVVPTPDGKHSSWAGRKFRIPPR